MTVTRRSLPLVAGVLALPALMRVARAGDAPRPLKIVDTPGRWASYELIFVADAQGFFAEQGLKLDLTVLPPEQYTVALDSGLTEFAPASDYAYLVNVVDKGLQVREVVASTTNIDPARANDGLFVPEASPIRSAADLRGKRIGMTNVVFSSAWFALEFLGRAGVHRTDVTYLPIPPLQQQQVLASGGVDAIYAFSPVDAQFRQHGGFRQIFDLGSLAGRRIARGGTMAKLDLIRREPTLVRSYVAAIAKAADWANAHQGEVVQLGVRLGRLPAALAPYAYTRNAKGDYGVLSWPTHGLHREEDVRFWLEVDERQGIVPQGKLRAADLYTNEFNPFASA